ncbi:MAG TPA: polymer-forming cytoskeletal protein [Pyrinomonadaceae bacterium]|jgi:cytoskeletal protein CcmA (bactofilin family)
MLRMGKNPKEQPDTEHNSETPNAPYNAARNYAAPPQTHQNAETQYRPQAEAASNARAVTESESLARDIKEGILSGFVGNGTMLTGDASFKGMLRVDGHISGTVTSEGGTLIVGNNGQVDANVTVAVATIHGTVNGDIIASQRLELGRAAKVTGNIQTPSLVIEQGAVFEGSCRMVQLKADFEKQRDQRTPDNGALDTTSMQPITDGSSETPSISDASDIAS